jgi:Spy/CpxP family protein refolding chaperone
MKTIKSLLALLSLGVASSALLSAQDQTNPSTPPAEGRRGGKAGQRGPGGQGEGRGQMMNPEARVAQLDRALSLTEDQKSKLTGIFAKQREEMQQAMQATRDQVQAVLTDDQKKKFEEIDRPGRGGPRGEGSKGGPRGGQGKRKRDA